MIEWLKERISAFAADTDLMILLGAVFGFLVLGTVLGQVLKLRSSNLAVNFNVRVRSWWMMCLVFAAAMATGGAGSVLLFMLTSFLALREFIAIVPTHRADHRIVVWCFWVVLPLQYLLVLAGWYGLFVILIPVYAFMFIPMRSVIVGDCDGFLERTAKIQWGLMACVYCISHAPMLLKLPLNFSDGG